jgi:formylmethanofuran dehydrogenase subunit E
MVIPAVNLDKKEGVMIKSYMFQEFVDLVASFHGYAAPGVIIGGFMVDLVYRYLPEEGLFDALCETPKCLPDAIQLLTPCTLGNGWLTVVNTGRFALTLYDKETGSGVRAFVDPVRLNRWSEIRAWFFKLKQKKEQNNQLLMMEIKEAGAGICDLQKVKVADRFLNKSHRRGFAICSCCGEAYPVDDGPICFGCRDPLWTVFEDSKANRQSSLLYDFTLRDAIHGQR